MPHPGARIYYQQAQSLLLKIFILFFLFFCFVSSCRFKMVVFAIILIRLYFNMYGYYSFPVYEIFYTTCYIYLI